MELGLINELLGKSNGNYSVMYPLLKDRLKDYTCEELPFPDEFLFFEDDYLLIKKHMIENGIDGDILDIGCQYGFQSELFMDNRSYSGIDCAKYRFFNTEKENVSYRVGMFPRDFEGDLKGKIVMSIMSLGYFNIWFEKDEAKAMDILENALKDCEVLYIATTPELTKRLEKHFAVKETLCQKTLLGKVFGVVYFAKQ